MRTNIRFISVASILGAVALISTLSVTPASATDNTWISAPSLTHVAISATGAVATNSGFTLSTQTSTFTLTYRGPVGDAGKFAQVNFFDLSSGTTIALASSPSASSTGCDQQVLGGDSKSCMFKLDGSGSANINGTLSGVTSSSAMKYHLLSGPNIAQTGDANITFATPNTTVKAVVSSTKAMVGGAAVLRFRFFNGATAASSVKASVTLKGLGDNLSSATVTSDSNGYAWIYVASLSKKTGSATITVTVDGTANKAIGTIKWVKGTLSK